MVTSKLGSFFVPLLSVVQAKLCSKRLIRKGEWLFNHVPNCPKCSVFVFHGFALWNPNHSFELFKKQQCIVKLSTSVCDKVNKICTMFKQAQHSNNRETLFSHQSRKMYFAAIGGVSVSKMFVALKVWSDLVCVCWYCNVNFPPNFFCAACEENNKWEQRTNEPKEGNGQFSDSYFLSSNLSCDNSWTK